MVDAPNKRRRGRPKTFERPKVVSVAMQSYWQDGVDGVSLNEVCRLAGVSKPGVYREFGGEDGLKAAAFKHYAEVVSGSMLSEVVGAQPFAQGLTALIQAVTTPAEARPLGCLLAKTRWSSARLGPETRAQVDAAVETVHEAFMAWVLQAKTRGEIPADIAVDVAAAFLITQFNTILMQMAAEEDPTFIRAQARLAFAGLLGSSLSLEETV